MVRVFPLFNIYGGLWKQCLNKYRLIASFLRKATLSYINSDVTGCYHYIFLLDSGKKKCYYSFDTSMATVDTRLKWRKHPGPMTFLLRHKMHLHYSKGSNGIALDRKTIFSLRLLRYLKEHLIFVCKLCLRYHSKRI